MFCSKTLKIPITYNPSSTKLVLSSQKSLSFLNNYLFYRRKSSMTMAMTSTAAAAMASTSKVNEPTVKLTASRTATNGRVNGLVSLRAWKALIVMLINTLLWFFLLPYRRRWRTVSEKGSGGGSCNVGGGCGVSAPEVSARRALAIKRVLQDNEDDDDDDDGTGAATATAREFSLFVTSRGDIMFTQSWTPFNTQTRGLVVIMHGLNEHSGRYKDLAKRLNANGYKVYGMDWVGHGGSDGLHAYVHSLDDAVDDMKSFIGKVLAENPSLPCFCFGHSTGAAIILKAVLDPKFSSRISGVVLTSPAVGVQPSHPIIAVIAPVLSFLLPRYQFSAANKRGIAVSRDPKALEAKYSDPLVFTGSIRVRTGYEILRITAFLQQNLRKLTVPFLVLHGTADTVTDPDASKKLYQEAASTDKTIKLYDGLLHDLLFEPEREEVLEDVIAWLNSRLQC